MNQIVKAVLFTAIFINNISRSSLHTTKGQWPYDADITFICLAHHPKKFPRPPHNKKRSTRDTYKIAPLIHLKATAIAGEPIQNTYDELNKIVSNARAHPSQIIITPKTPIQTP